MDEIVIWPFLIWKQYFQDKSKDKKANPLSVKNIGGVFVVLVKFKYKVKLEGVWVGSGLRHCFGEENEKIQCSSPSSRPGAP